MILITTVQTDISARKQDRTGIQIHREASKNYNYNCTRNNAFILVVVLAVVL